MPNSDNAAGHEPEEQVAATAAETNITTDGVDAVEYSSNTHINSPLKKHLRIDTATLAACFDPKAPAEDRQGSVQEALATAASLTDENERLPHKTGFSSGDHAKRIAKLRNKRIPKTSFAKEFSRLPQNKSDAESGLEVGKHTWRGFVAGVMSAQKDAESKKDARLAAELEEARDAQRELDRREKDNAQSTDDAVRAAAEKAESRGDGNTPKSGGGEGPAGENSDPNASGSVDDQSEKPEEKTGVAAEQKTEADPSAQSSTAIARPVEPTKSNGDSVPSEIDGQSKSSAALVDGKETALGPKPQERGRMLSLSPTADLGTSLEPKNAAPNARKGKLFDQARSLPKMDAPIRGIGPQNPTPRVRAQGLGFHIASFVKAARALAPRDPAEISAAAWLNKRRDQDGLSR